jgi:predicted RNA binding protein YcfA (HicA-like mRNA interferase family)
MGQVFSSKQLIKMITAAGWNLVSIEGDHHNYKHPTKPGKITITHPVKDMPKGTANSILKQAGLK